jgi:hypothetical protein
MGGFANAIGGLGSDTTNITRAREMARQHARERLYDLQQTALHGQQLRQGEQHLKAGQQQIDQASEPYPVGAPQLIKGHKIQLVYRPGGGFQQIDLGPETNPYEQNLEDFKHITGWNEADGPPTQDQLIKAAAAGIHMPSSLMSSQTKGRWQVDENNQLQWVPQPVGTEPGKPIATGVKARPTASQMDTVRQGVSFQTIDDPDNPGHQILKEMPTTTRTTHVPRGTAGAGAATAPPPSGGAGPSAQGTPTPSRNLEGTPSEGRTVGGKNKLSESEKRTVDAINTTLPLLTNDDPAKGDLGVIPFLEQNNLTKKNSYMDAAKQRKAWIDYNTLGRDPDDPVSSKIIKYAAALQVIPIAAYQGMRSSKYSFEAIIAHLPKPTDTPQNVYQKSLFLRDAIIKHQQESMEKAAGAPGTKYIGPNKGAMTDEEADKILRDQGVLK